MILYVAPVRKRERKFDKENVCFYHFQGDGVQSPITGKQKKKPQAECDRV